MIRNNISQLGYILILIFTSHSCTEKDPFYYVEFKDLKILEVGNQTGTNIFLVQEKSVPEITEGYSFVEYDKNKLSKLHVGDVLRKRRGSYDIYIYRSGKCVQRLSRD